MEFPGNSHESKRIQDQSAQTETPPTPEPKKVEKVVTGNVTQRKKSLGKRFGEMFFTGGKSFADYVVESVVIPTAKDLVLTIITTTADSFRQGFEEMLFGEDAKNRPRRTVSYGTGRPVINYSSFSARTTTARTSTTSVPIVQRTSNIPQEIVLESRDEVDLVKDALEELINSYGHCTVGDLYSAVGIKPVPTDEEWGWETVELMRARMIGPNQYKILLPKTIPIQAG